MRAPSPERWTDQLWRVTITLLATAIGLNIVWSILRPLLPILLIGAGLVLVVRLAVGVHGRRDDW